MIDDDTRHKLRGQRALLLERIQNLMELPMVVLAFVWLALFVLEAVRGISPTLEMWNHIIWALFAAELAVSLVLAPVRSEYLRRNWLAVIAVVAPALRIARVARVLRIGRVARASQAVRGMRLLRMLTSINRGMSALSRTMRRRGFGYVVLLTITVTLVAAAAMYSFEHETARGPGSYGEALWWTAMMITTMGSDYWPGTVEGRILCLLLAVYAFAIFGYVTATIASFFIGKDASEDQQQQALVAAIASLREEVESLRRNLPEPRPVG
jgi:voltage-gated potassium channel